jgi:hypothetical protein
MSAAQQQEERRHPRHRLAWLVAAALGSLVLGAGVTVVGLGLSRSAGIRGMYGQVEVGMTLEQVEGLLGRPTGGILDSADSGWKWWSFGEYTILVEFDKGAVNDKHLESELRTLQDWLKALSPF